MIAVRHFHSYAPCNIGIPKCVADPGSVDEFDAVQIELLQRHRAGTTDGRVQRSIYLTINGIAVGLKNSG